MDKEPNAEGAAAEGAPPKPEPVPKLVVVACCVDPNALVAVVGLAPNPPADLLPKALDPNAFDVGWDGGVPNADGAAGAVDVVG